jgi:hypothetical protein
MMNRKGNVKMLKNAKLASVGDMIRGYDFKPMAGREDCYVEGKVLSAGYQSSAGYDAFEILCTRDVYAGERQMEGVKGSRVGQIVFVPFEVSFMEYDGRVLNLSK